MKSEDERADLYQIINDEIVKYSAGDYSLEAYDLKEKLMDLRKVDSLKYHNILKTIPDDLLADILIELPEDLQEEAAESLGTHKISGLIAEMDSDDATDFIQSLGNKDDFLAKDVLSRIDEEERENIETLITYEKGVAGAYMQLELFSAKLDENIGTSIKRLKKIKLEDEIDNIHHVYVTDKAGKFLGAIGLEELIVHDYKSSYRTIIENEEKAYSHIAIGDKDPVDQVIETVSNYNLSVVPVVNMDKVLVGRITSDDMYDMIEEQATEDIYQMAGVNATVETKTDFDILKIAKSRGLWLGINLLTAILASVVISFFGTTIQSYVSLAILMPIVASMGGNAGTQSLTVTVRQLALGKIDDDDAIRTIKKETLLSLINGLIFSVIIGILSYLWFQLPLLGVVIALSTVFNLLFAGFFGSVIPLLLEKIDVDPALGSSVVLTAITDIVGFLSFLGLAKLILG